MFPITSAPPFIPIEIARVLPSLVLSLGLDALVGLEVLIDRRQGWDLARAVGSTVASAAGGPEGKTK